MAGQQNLKTLDWWSYALNDTLTSILTRIGIVRNQPLGRIASTLSVRGAKKFLVH
jgi:hypothetical protein